MADDFEPFNDDATTSAMQAIYDRIRELDGGPGMVALADRVAARIRNKEGDQ